MASSKPTLGVNDLQSQFPDIAAEAYGWDPETVTAGSGKKMDWKCKEGHIYTSIVAGRTSKGSGCIFCCNQKLLAGFNDLQTKFPDIAAEAYGWDPTTVVAGTEEKKDWKCIKGHIYTSVVKRRTGQKSGCPICSGRQVLSGYNDLRTKFPDIAAEAYEWDPTTVTAKSGQKKDWKCKEGHIYTSTVAGRTSTGNGCSVCCNQKLLAGFNDLQTKFPDIAAEADGWDPSTVIPGTPQKKNWKCNLGHNWNAIVRSRTQQGSGCPVCANKKILVGFNDLQTKFPNIAAEADDWDPSTVFPGTIQKKNWKCNLGHKWVSTVLSRTQMDCGCPVCANKKILVGFNDLQTKFPDIAAEADGWDPTITLYGSAQKRNWICKFGHKWDTTVDKRTSQGTGCPSCAEYGFNPDKDAWFYLMQRDGEQQLGITNNIIIRTDQHSRNGWNLLDSTGPALGQKVLDTETAFKKWLKKEIGLMDGTTENWSTSKVEVQSLAELKARSGIETDLF